jgi:hypothetical protein
METSCYVRRWLFIYLSCRSNGLCGEGEGFYRLLPRGSILGVVRGIEANRPGLPHSITPRCSHAPTRVVRTE